MTLPKLSLCIPTKDRWSFLSVNIPKYLANTCIDEIVICDEDGKDAALLNTTFADAVASQKLRVYVNDSCLGAFHNKRKVVSLAKNTFVCLMDSDNYAPPSYFDAWYAFLGSEYPKNDVIYSPSGSIAQQNHPGFHFESMEGICLNRENYKHFWKKEPHCKNGLYNIGNYIFSKKIYEAATPQGDPRWEALADHTGGVDVLFQNFLLWEKCNVGFTIVPRMQYNHIVHDGSYYCQTFNPERQAMFEALYN